MTSKNTLYQIQQERLQRIEVERQKLRQTLGAALDHPPEDTWYLGNLLFKTHKHQHVSSES